ncbi:MAG: SGNH/GDSL hydrolase family protein [Clostridia bacterium]|nr:SGNH/GDSL hydrolase family protein [Clostridia bacterium]
MKAKLLSWILLLSLLLGGCAGESVLGPTETKEAPVTVQTVETKTEEVKTQPETLPATEEVTPTALRLNEEEKLARNAKLAEVLKGKKVSFIGDSISTFEGYSNNTAYNATIGGNKVYYTGDKRGFTDVNKTWWMQVANATGMELLVNNSWSGDRVTNRGVARAKELHNNQGVKPDVIVVYLGINDFRKGITPEAFKAAYDKMIGGMKEAYPEAEVYLCDLVYSSGMNNPGFRPKEVVKTNAVIAEIAQKYQATLVDLYNGTGITWRNLAEHMCDEVLHPNYKGMEVMAECILSAMAEDYLQ